MRITQAFHGSFTGVELDIPATVVSVVFKLISIFLIAPVLAMNGMSPVLRYFKSNSLSSNSVALGSVLKRNVSVWFLKDRKSTRLNSSHSQISYAVFCLKKKKKKK